MTSQQPAVRVQAHRPGDVLAVIPRMMGFHPADSLVVVGITGEGRIDVVFRYDMPEIRQMAEVSEHATTILQRQHMRRAVLIGYGPGQRVTP
jgi:hypothetical protein